MSDLKSSVKDFLLGGTSGCIAKTACAPLERIKIVLQTQSAGSGVQQYDGMRSCARGIFAESGVAGFWRGNLVNCMRYFPNASIGFMCKERYQKIFVPDKEKSSFGAWFAGYLLAGGLAGATALTVVYPLEFAYTRIAADVTGTKFNGLGDCVKKIAAVDGYKGLYRGFGPSVAGIIICT
jgi:solute carrier family 25 (adenine nucleotide translocator) protein 4/5/6/31